MILPETSASQPVTRLPIVRDWVTLALFAGCISVWFAGIMLAQEWPISSFVMVVLSLVLHSSLSHEILHGSPFTSVRACTLLGLVQPGIAIPYLRFKRLHLAHHMDANLTDPYDDPEANYLDPAVWAGLPRWQKTVLRFNNTLFGRMLVGPALGQWRLIRDDASAICKGDRLVAMDWVLHMPGVILVLAAVAASPMSVWVYFCAVYGALSILKIRTYLEHQAHAHFSGRTVIIEDRGLLSFLFLNNNLHVVHHMHPTVAWHKLPALYRSQRARFVARNHGYVYTCYGSVMRQYFWRSKDPVPHPIWQPRKD